MSKRWLGLLLPIGLWLSTSGVAHAAVTVTVTPNPIDTGPVMVGSLGSGDGMLSASVSTAVTLQLHTGGDCAQFAISSPVSLTIGTTPVTVTVQLTPTSTGVKNCMIDVLQGATAIKTFGVTGTSTGTPQLNVDPGSLPFGAIEVGHTSTSQRVTATNPGNATLTIAGASFTTGGSSYTLVAGTTGSQTVPAMGSVTWDIACRPQAAGGANGTFQIVSNAPTGGTASVDLTCSGNQGLITTDQLSIDFGAVLLAGSRLRTVTLSNTGNVTITSVRGAFDKPNAGYSIDPSGPVPGTLNPGDMIGVKIKFAPVTPGDGGAVTLTFSGSWGAGNTATKDVSLTGQTVSLGVTPTSLDFMSFPFDSAPTQVFHIVNSGGTAVGIDLPTFTSDDAGTGPGDVIITQIRQGNSDVTLPANLPGGQQLDVTVKATPGSRTGLVKGHFTVHATTSGIPDQQVAITGTATAAVVNATAMVEFPGVDIDAAAIQAPMQTATIMNTGMANLTITSITKMAGASTAFTIPLPMTPVQVTPNNTLTIPITFKPTTEHTAATPDSVVLVASLSGILGGPTQVMITIHGYGIDRTLAVDAAPTFPPTFKNPGDSAPIRAVTVHNNGDAVLGITAVMVTGGPVWQLVDDSPVDIAGRGSHDFMIKFSPTAVGEAPLGQLTLTSNDNLNASKTITLSGTGVNRDVAFGPDPAPTGPIDVGVTGVEARITANVLVVTNHDPAAAFTIHAIQLSGDAAFHLVAGPADDALPASSTKTFAIAFAPTAVGDFETTATLFLDQDPEAQAEIQIVGHAVSLDVHGGGGCATGRGLGGGAVVLVLAAGLAGGRRRRRAVVIGVALAALPARAFADDVRVGAFDPTPQTTGTGIQVESADVGDNGAWVASGVVSYATNPMLVAVASSDGAVETQRPIARSTLVELGGAYAFLGRFEAGLRMPFYSQRGDVAGATAGTSVMVPAVSGTALGDLALHAKVRIVDLPNVAALAALTAGAAVHITLPTSTSDQFTGVDLPTLRVLGLATVTPIPRLALSLNGGAVLRKTADYRNQIFIEQGSGLAWGAGASVRAADRLFATGELFGELVPKARAMTGSVSPIECLVGASYRSQRGFTVGFAVGRGLSSALGSPEVRGTFTLSFTSGTGGLAPADREPPTVRVAAGTAAGPELDSDHDGIPDSRDRCPLEPEDKDGFQDADGCPDPDNDGDGIPDAQDRCPNEPETINGIQDEDGCPDVGGDTAAPVKVAPDRSPKQAAEDAFQRGRALLEQKNYLAACAAFEQSQRLDPAAGTRYNLATCDAEIGKLATAWTLFRELARSDKNAERRAKSAELAAQLAPRVPRLKMILHGAPSGTNVVLNATNVNALIGIDAPVDFGSYTIVASAPRHRDWRKTVEVKQEAEVITVDIDLGPELAR